MEQKRENPGPIRGKVPPVLGWDQRIIDDRIEMYDAYAYVIVFSK